MAHTRWVASTPRDCRCRKASADGGQRLWKSRAVETPKQGSHGAWKSRKERGIPTFPQPRRRRASNMYWKADTSRVTKTGHLSGGRDDLRRLPQKASEEVTRSGVHA